MLVVKTCRAVDATHLTQSAEGYCSDFHTRGHHLNGVNSGEFGGGHEGLYFAPLYLRLRCLILCIWTGRYELHDMFAGRVL